MNQPKIPSIFAINVLPGALEKTELPDGHIPISITGILYICQAMTVLDRIEGKTLEDHEKLKEVYWYLKNALSYTNIGEDELEHLEQAVYDMMPEE